MYTDDSLEFLRQSLGENLLPPTVGRLEEKYTLVRHVSKGANGNVFAGVRQNDDLKVIVKTTDKLRTPTLIAPSAGERPLPIEALVLYNLSDIRGVIDIVEYFESETEYQFVLEHVPNSEELYVFVTISSGGALSEGATRYFLRQVVTTLQQMWQRGYVHGDVKEENLLLNKDTLEIKLLDLGSVEKNGNDDLVKVLKGTPWYTPPEAHAMNGFKDGDSLTVFSIGVMAYKLMFTYLPFPVKDEYVPDINMNGINIELVSKGVSHGARHFLYYCLHTEPSRRLKLNKLLEHPWLKDDLPTEDEVRREISCVIMDFRPPSEEEMPVASPPSSDDSNFFFHSSELYLSSTDKAEGMAVRNSSQGNYNLNSDCDEEEICKIQSKGSPSNDVVGTNDDSNFFFHSSELYPSCTDKAEGMPVKNSSQCNNNLNSDCDKDEICKMQDTGSPSNDVVNINDSSSQEHQVCEEERPTLISFDQPQNKRPRRMCTLDSRRITKNKKNDKRQASRSTKSATKICKDDEKTRIPRSSQEVRKVNGERKSKKNKDVEESEITKQSAVVKEERVVNGGKRLKKKIGDEDAKATITLMDEKKVRKVNRGKRTKKKEEREESNVIMQTKEVKESKRGKRMQEEESRSATSSNDEKNVRKVKRGNVMMKNREYKKPMTTRTPKEEEEEEEPNGTSCKRTRKNRRLLKKQQN